jgi:hypothetical protein
MITKVWLKSQPNKRIDYPDCFPLMNEVKRINGAKMIDTVRILNLECRIQASYKSEAVSRIEFRP